MAKILLADDSDITQRMGAQILSAEGHEVTTVSNGQAAIKMLHEFSPDLIVADVFMPGKSGYELCEFVKSDPESSWIPVLLIVAPMEPYDKTEGYRVKADGLVTKPLNESNLVETVQALLASAKRPKKRLRPKIVHPHHKPSDFIEESVGSFLCLDSDEFESKGTDAAHWVKDFQFLFLDEPGRVPPAVVVIGTAKRLSQEEVSKTIKSYTSAGAIYYKRPLDMSRGEIIKRISIELSKVYESVKPAPKGIESVRVGDSELQFYADPPYQLPDKAFTLLLQRMKLADSSHEKDD